MQPWVTGPAEILEHGLSLLETDSDKNRRLAMIAIDNSVELAIKTYLGLPKRITGLLITRKEYAEISESFPRLLDALEKYCEGKLEGLDLGEIEWYHRIRNQLYHQGNGLTVEREKVTIYSELAKLLFKNLFDADIEFPTTDEHEIMGKFLSEWVKLERAISKLASQYRSDLTVTGQKLPPPLIAFNGLAGMKIIPENTSREIDYFRVIRNKLVHGEIEGNEIKADYPLKIQNITKIIADLAKD